MTSLPFDQPTSRSSGWFAAKFPGICETCGEGFEQGWIVRYEGSDLVHADPDDCMQFKDRPIQKPCRKCFLVHSGECF